VPIFCNNSNSNVLECYFGQLSFNAAAFIPTTSPYVQFKDQSILRKIYKYFANLLGIEIENENHESFTKWIPQPLEIAQEPITTPEPHLYLVRSNDNRVPWHYYTSLSHYYIQLEKSIVQMSAFEKENIKRFTISEYSRMKSNGEVLDF
jgi:hypothetical protein